MAKQKKDTPEEQNPEQEPVTVVEPMPEETTPVDPEAPAEPTLVEPEIVNPNVEETLETEDNPEQDDLQKHADKLMASMFLKVIYRTDDGQWFSDRQNAETHAAKIDSVVEVFKPSKKQ